MASPGWRQPCQSQRLRNSFFNWHGLVLACSYAGVGGDRGTWGLDDRFGSENPSQLRNFKGDVKGNPNAEFPSDEAITNLAGSILNIVLKVLKGAVEPTLYLLMK